MRPSPRPPLPAASIVALCTGYLLDLVSGAPQGVHALVFVLVAVVARALSARVAVQGIVLSAATSFVASLLAAPLHAQADLVVDPRLPRHAGRFAIVHGPPCACVHEHGA